MHLKLTFSAKNIILVVAPGYFPFPEYKHVIKGRVDIADVDRLINVGATDQMRMSAPQRIYPY